MAKNKTEKVTVNQWAADKLAELGDEWIEKRGAKLLARHRTDDIEFATWLEMFNIILRRKILMSYDDLEDWDYYSNYEAGSTPRDAVNDMMEDLGIPNAEGF